LIIITIYFLRSYPGPPPCPPYSLQSSSAQHDGQLLSYLQQNVRIIPAHHLLFKSRIFTPITSKLQIFFILTGISYLLWGAASIALEISIIMYSHSIYYRGIFAGTIMLGSAVNLLIVSHRVAHSMIYMVRLLSFVFVFCLVGIVLSIIDLCTSRQCENRMNDLLCDIQIARILKMIILIELTIAAAHTGVNLAIARHVQKKSTSMSPVEDCPSYQF